MPHEAAPMMAMGAWIAMMLLMMLPSLLPHLWRYHRVLGRMKHAPAGMRTAVYCLAYGAIWGIVSGIAHECADVFGDATRRLPALSALASVGTATVIMAAGALQLTRWKAHHLARCGEAALAGCGARTMMMALRDGARHGFHCTASCAGHVAILLVLGAMDARAMIAMTAVITAERVLPAGTRVARALGVLAMCAGAIMLPHAVLVSLFRAP